MTWYVSFRSQAVAGTPTDPRVYEWQHGAAGVRQVPDLVLDKEVRGKDILLGTHGFNVDQTGGLNSLGGIDVRLRPLASELFLGVLWPGDWWIPAVNYPVEADDAVDCGRRLAAFCKAKLRSANSLSFLSHSLGARLILEAVKQLDRPAHIVCVTAAATDFDCLDRQYAGAIGNCGALLNLASRGDKVLQYAYPAGDFLSDVFGDDDSPFNRALGRSGPRHPWAKKVAPYQIHDRDDHGHGDYLPPDAGGVVNAGDKWPNAVDFMVRAFRGKRQTWPR
jgi:hypothetical protein